MAVVDVVPPPTLPDGPPALKAPVETSTLLGEPQSAGVGDPDRAPGFDVQRFQQSRREAVSPTEAATTARRPAAAAGGRADGSPAVHRIRPRSPARSVGSAIAGALAPLRRHQLTPVHWALAAAVVLVIAQAVFIGTRLAGTRSAPAPTASEPARERPAISTSPPAATSPEAAPVSMVGTTRPVPQPAERPSPRPSPGPSRLVVRSDPPGAAVTVNGRPRGVTPLTMQGVVPGKHKVVVHGPAGPVEHEVVAQPGETATVLASLAPATVAGWVSVRSPAVVQIFEGEELLGTSASPRLMLTAGRHTLDLVNEELGYRTSQVVDIAAGEVARLTPEMPDATVHLNALPWAEVWIAGRKVGDTPLGNLQLPIGAHEVVFRNPDYPEITRTVVATLRGPTRVSVTFERERR